MTTPTPYDELRERLREDVWLHPSEPGCPCCARRAEAVEAILDDPSLWPAPPTPYDELRERLEALRDEARDAEERLRLEDDDGAQAFGVVRVRLDAILDDFPAPPAAEAGAAAASADVGVAVRRSMEVDRDRRIALSRLPAAASEQEARCPACGQVCGTWAASEPEYAYQPPPEITSGSVSASEPPPSTSAPECPRARSNWTPCFVKDGDCALSNGGYCVGCGWTRQQIALPFLPSSEPPPAAGPREQPAEDGTDRLCRALYGRAAEPRDYLGGSQATMLHDAADRLAREQPAGDRLTVEERKAVDWLDHCLRNGDHYRPADIALTVGALHRLAPAPSPAPAEQGEQS